MTISSINFQRVRGEKKQALDHIARTTEKEPEYLLEKNERKPNGFELLADVEKLHEKQMETRKQNHSRGKAPDLNDSLWEAVINLEEHHTLADVKKVADFIKQKYHLTPTAIAIHRDEGYKDKITNKTKYNYHSHVMFYTVENGKSQMRTIGKKALSEMQTEVAKLLGMERGQLNSKAVRLDHKQYREVKRTEEKTQLELVKTQKELNELKSKIRQQMIEQGGFSAQDYRSLNQLITDYKNAFKLGETVTVSEVVKDIYRRLNNGMKVKAENDRLTSENDTLKIENADLRRQLSDLQAQKSSETPQKRSQRDESDIERVEVPQTPRFQSMSVLEQNTTEEKRYSVKIGRQSYDWRAEDIKEWLEEYPEDKDSFYKQLSDVDKREVFGEPKQTPSRVKHGFHR